MAGPRGLVIAIDGVIGAGKSTAARGAAQALRYRHLDTGAMYRAVALAAKARGVSAQDDPALEALLDRLDLRLDPGPDGTRIHVGDIDVSEAIRGPEVTRIVGAYADRPQVRRRLVDLQRRMGVEGGIVAEGRDMSTVVFPDADLKLRMIAGLDERSARRHREFASRGIEISFEQVRRDIQTRDEEDARRDYGASGPPTHVLEVDTGGLTPEQVVARIVALARQHGA